ncbi:MAG: ABC transporter permease [Acidobacteriota bacterium]
MSLFHDVRLAARNLVRAPGFTAVTILTLALGIGVNTAIFSVVRGVILRPLPYPEPERVMFITSRFPDMGFDQFWVSPPEYFELQEWSRSYAALGAFSTGEANLSASDRPRRVRTGAVDDHLLRALAVPAARGRHFTSQEARAGGPNVVLLSHEIWQSAFAGREMLGQTIDLDGRSREVVGVMPPGFDVLDEKVEVWVPLGLDPANRRNRGNHRLYLVGRLAEGVSQAQAAAEFDSLYGRWAEEFSGTHRPSAEFHQLQIEAAQDEVVGGASRAIWVLQAAVAFVLLIACANLANLLLARAESRHREFAVRAALGAGRWRLLRQFLTEGILLAVAGGALGLGVAVASLRALITAYPDSLPRAGAIALDPLVLGFTLAVSLATGLFFGLAPLLHLSPSSLAGALKDSGGRGATGAARHWIRRGLVMAEIALAVMLVVGAGLMLRTVVNLMEVDAGFDRAPLTTFALDLPAARYPDGPSVVRFYDGLAERLRRAPGVQGVTVMSGLPPNRRVDANDTDIEGYQKLTEEDPFENVDYYQFASANYFDVMGIPIVEGRSFEPSDVTRGPVAVVNEALAERFYRGQNPVGRRLSPDPERIGWFTIVGVAKDVKQGGVDQRTGTEMYFLAEQAAAAGFPQRNMNVVVRSTLPAESLRSVIDAAVREADDTLPVIRYRAMEDVFAASVSRPRLIASLLGAFGVLALLLAAIGTYGVLSYMVGERRREIGIRMALGAAQTSVLGLVLRQGLLTAGVGLAAGVAAAVALTRLMEALLFGVRPADAATLAAVAVTVAAVATLACLVPAHRASRVDPLVVLRDE